MITDWSRWLPRWRELAFPAFNDNTADHCNSVFAIGVERIHPIENRVFHFAFGSTLNYDGDSPEFLDLVSIFPINLLVFH